VCSFLLSYLLLGLTLLCVFPYLCAQVLSDESLRASYDANGKAGVEAAPKVG
jgi:hypothetical protein